jgi:arginine N-succinyltransferase
MLIRPIAGQDLDGLVQMASQSGFGLTTLPFDRDLLRDRILESERSFEQMPEKPGGESYLFVLVDPATESIVGTSGVVSKVGGFEPFYAYRIETSSHDSEVHLVAEHSGPCEIGSLFLSPAHRRGGNGRFLSLFRFLFMAEYLKSFEPVVIAEMRGVSDKKGQSPFWDALGIHFFNIAFPKADHLSMKDKRFIAELMPTHPIYIPLLPKAAQDVIGQVHPATGPALKILEKEGFKFTGMVDIFDGGPIISCELEKVRSVKESVKSTVSQISSHNLESAEFIIANPLQPFRACLGRLEFSQEGGIVVSSGLASLLNLEVGDSVRYVRLRA